MSFELEKHSPDSEVNNTKLCHSYRFDGILPMEIKQDDVLNIVAKPVIDDVLNGVNGTIFAYGQTGSGKTFTITGGAERYSDRGLIPRTLSYMFQAFKASESHYRMYVSYLEIYQRAGYDLLRDDKAQQLEDLPKVTLREDEDGNMHLRNLSVNVAGSEEDALNLLFLGDTNRQVAETPMNDASTRSHCLFIIWVDSTKPGSDVIRRSKLHLVDLAGSERVSKTGVDGKLLQEATDINLSLHYLERVIVALHDRSKGKASHVPYRDSMMTSVLRDSLGGNCKTTMIGCIAVEQSNLQESISTCSFAQRVAQIQNNAKVNEELDPNLLIARLKREVAQLKEEVRVAKENKGEDEGDLTEEELEKCRAMVLQYVASKSKEPFVCGSVGRLRASFRILRDLCNSSLPGGSPAGMDPQRQAALEAEAKKLELEIAQRDQEIGIMVHMLSKQRNAEGRPFIAASSSPAGDAEGGESLQARVSALAATPAPQGPVAPVPAAASAAPPEPHPPPAAKPKARRPYIPGEKPQQQLPPVADAAELLLDKQQAYEVFRSSVYKAPEAFEQQKGLLKERMASAKLLGDEAMAVRSGINASKTRLEKLRTERAMTAAGYDDSAPIEDGPEEIAEVRELDRLRALYKERTDALRHVKHEVERVQRMLEQSKVRMQKEFETWFSALRRQASLAALDEETKKDLYEKVTGGSVQNSRVSTPSGAAAAATGTPSAAMPMQRPSVPSLSGGVASRTSSARSPPSSSQAGSAALQRSVRPAVTGDTKTDDDIAAFYAALGNLM